MGRMQGKVALISGAAAAMDGQLMGFGGASAHAFAREGARVVLTDIRDDLGTASVEAMRARGYDARYRRLDVTVEADWRDAVAFTLAEFGELNVLVNNAGAVARVDIEDMEESVWDRELSIHAKGVFLGTKSVIPAMRAAGGGSIVNISSIMGIVGSPTSPAYSAAKGAIRLFTKTTALQYAKENIRANSVHPGYAETPLTEEAFNEPRVRDALLRKTPMRRLGRAEDIANGVLYLASDESSFMTGAELVIDGGMTAQ